MSVENTMPHCIIVAEVAQAHDGSLGMAHAFVDTIADAGADAVKFQTHIAEAESSPDEPWRIKFSPQDATRFDYWKRMEFTEEQWHGLKRHADDRGLAFLSSPFSIEAVELLERVGITAWKVASGEVGNVPLFERMSKSKLPFIVSSGMSNLEELDAAVERVRSYGLPVTVLQCTTAYPCPPDKVGLNLIAELRERYSCGVGLSDHSGTIYAGLAAAALGIDMLEVHVTFSKQMFGPDVPASVTLEDLHRLVEGVRFIEDMRVSPVDKDAIFTEMAPLRTLFTRSIVARHNLPAGTVLLHEHFTFKKPGTGMPAAHVSNVVGKRLIRSLAAGARLELTDMES